VTVSLVNTMVRVLLLAVDTRVPVPLHMSDSTVTLVSRLTHTHTQRGRPLTTARLCSVEFSVLLTYLFHSTDYSSSFSSTSRPQWRRV